MIKHIVFFKLKDRAKDLQIAKESLLAMRDQIEVIRHLEVGVDLDRSERAFDLALVTHFDSMDDLKKYIAHENHQPVIKLMREICEKSHVVDYEI